MSRHTIAPAFTELTVLLERCKPKPGFKDVILPFIACHGKLSTLVAREVYCAPTEYLDPSLVSIKHNDHASVSVQLVEEEDVIVLCLEDQPSGLYMLRVYGDWMLGIKCSKVSASFQRLVVGIRALMPFCEEHSFLPVRMHFNVTEFPIVGGTQRTVFDQGTQTDDSPAAKTSGTTAAHGGAGGPPSKPALQEVKTDTVHSKQFRGQTLDVKMSQKYGKQITEKDVVKEFLHEVQRAEQNAKTPEEKQKTRAGVIRRFIDFIKRHPKKIILILGILAMLGGLVAAGFISMAALSALYNQALTMVKNAFGYLSEKILENARALLEYARNAVDAVFGSRVPDYGPQSHLWDYFLEPARTQLMGTTPSHMRHLGFMPSLGKTPVIDMLIKGKSFGAAPIQTAAAAVPGAAKVASAVEQLAQGIRQPSMFEYLYGLGQSLPSDAPAAAAAALDEGWFSFGLVAVGGILGTLATLGSLVSQGAAEAARNVGPTAASAAYQVVKIGAEHVIQGTTGVPVRLPG